MNKHTILLADDHQLILDALAKAAAELETVETVLTAVNGAEALHHPALPEVSLLVTDIEMPVMGGIELLRRIKDQHPAMKVLMLTMHNDAALIREIIGLGADGYLLKSAPMTEMHLAIGMLLEGKKYFSQDVTLELASAKPVIPAGHELLSSLTEREREILVLVAQGFSNKQIGERLFISTKTVDTHRTKIMSKLDIHNAAGLTRFAMQLGLV